jgi:hypothetical protein
MRRRHPARQPEALLDILLAALAVAGCAGCGSDPAAPGRDATVCNPIECPAPYQVTFTRAAWPAGTYRITATVDGTANSCEIDFPLFCGVPPRCTSAATWAPLLTGCALPPDRQSIHGISFSADNPMSVEVAVFQAMRRLGGATFTPMYATSEPGGPGCGTCRSGTSTLPLDP